MAASHSTLSLDDGTTVIGVICTGCHEPKQFTVKTESYERWTNGALIQRGMPEIPEDERELLISGLCGKCWDRIFEPEEEE